MGREEEMTVERDRERNDAREGKGEMTIQIDRDREKSFFNNHVNDFVAMF